ncbi:MAG TPA: response regulator [Pyrinomonadaceae bacterium]|jgi:CheY-like chemotaxis protein|nr:response regulator [Pyrinomonadaceae bacterium]
MFIPTHANQGAPSFPFASSHSMMSGAFNRQPGGAPLAGDGHEADKGKPLALVVDDAPDVTEMIAMLMSIAGYDVVKAFSAAEAFDRARQEHFTVVVSDIGMPVMNGYELAEALRALPAYRDVPLIAVTGFAMYDDRERALSSGFNDFLTKPINPMDLIDLVKRLRD